MYGWLFVPTLPSLITCSNTLFLFSFFILISAFEKCIHTPSHQNSQSSLVLSPQSDTFFTGFLRRNFYNKRSSARRLHNSECYYTFVYRATSNFIIFSCGTHGFCFVYCGYSTMSLCDS